MKNEIFQKITDICSSFEDLQITSLSVHSQEYSLWFKIGVDEYRLDLPLHTVNGLWDIIELAIVKTPAI